MSIEHLRAGDAGALIALASRIDLFTPPEVDVVKWIVGSYLDSNPWQYRIISYKDETQQTILGFATYGPVEITHGTFALQWLGIAPEAQGRGIGSKLLQYVERDVEQLGAHLLVIETSSQDKYLLTRKFYEKHGYESSAFIRDYYAPGDSKIIYTKYFGASDSHSPGRLTTPGTVSTSIA